MLFNISTGKEDLNEDWLTQYPTDSEWFGSFNLGCKKRMRQDVHPQLGLLIEVMKEYIERLAIKSCQQRTRKKEICSARWVLTQS
jgi:hypothetical protein